MIRLLFAIGLIFTTIAGNSASAHPGHGHAAGESGLMHYMTSPLHFGGFLLFLTAALAIWRIAVAVQDRFDSKD